MFTGSASKQPMSVEPTYLHFSFPCGPLVKMKQSYVSFGSEF